MARNPEGAEFPWYPKPVNDMAEGADGLNEESCVCLMMEGCKKEAQDALYAAMTSLAEAAKAGGAEELYFCAKASGQIADQVRKLTKIGDASDKPQLVILDIPDQGGYYVSEDKVDAEGIAAFVAKFKAGGLERKQLG